MTHILTHLAAFAALAAAAWTAGTAFCPPRLDAYRQLARFTIGLVFWSAGIFALAALGRLDALGLTGLAALALVVLAARRTLFAIPREKPARRPWRLAVLVPVLVPGFVWAAFFGPLMSHVLAPTVFADAAVYHLTLPRLYLENGGFRAVPFLVYSHWPQAVELLFAGAMLIQGYMLAKAVHLGFGVLLAAALWSAFQNDPTQNDPTRQKSSWTGFLAAAFFLANPVVAFELRLAYVDLAHAFFFFIAFLFLDRALELADDERARSHLLVAGIAAGALCGVKLTGVISAGILGALFLPRLVAAARQGRLAAAARPFLLYFALPVVLLFVPWLVKSAWMTGNPVYPFLYGVFGGPDWSAELAARFAEWQRAIGMGRSALDYLLLLPRVILLGGRGYENFDGEIGDFWIVLLPLAAAAALAGRVSRRSRHALAVAGLAFLFWALSSQQTRFLIPVLPLVALAAADAVHALVEKLPRFRRAGRAVALGVAVVLTLMVYAPYLGGGLRNWAALARFEGDLAATVVPPALRYLNQETPADARVLMLNVNQGFFLEREFIADSFFEASQIAAWLADAAGPPEVRQRLAARGVTHVLLDPRPKVAWPPALVELLGDPAQATAVFRSPDGTRIVFALRPAGDGA